MAHAPEVSELDLKFLFLSGRVSLALSATLGERWRRGFERLRSPADLAAWFVQSDLLSQPPSVSAAELAQARVLRESIYRTAKALASGRTLPAGDQKIINSFALHPTPIPHMLNGTLVWRTSNPVASALSVVARDAIDLFTGPFAHRIRECESDTCELLFVDTSRPGKRRWCSSDSCGTRSRSAAYRNRHH